MKSQDILILLKLVTISHAEKQYRHSDYEKNHWLMESDDVLEVGWQGWEPDHTQLKDSSAALFDDRYALRGLESLTGVSKTEVGSSLKRSVDCGLASYDRMTHHPKTNTKALLEFLIYGVKYVFPVKPAEIVRGIPTSFAAPVMRHVLATAGDIINVWPDPRGKEMGQAVKPLYKTVPKAIRYDPSLYELLALIDALRLGSPRESNLAKDLLGKKLRK